MNLYFLEPEVSGGLGKNTIFSNNVDGDGGNTPLKNVEFLHYEFGGWLGDDLLESTPCFIVSSNLEETLSRSSLDGLKIEPCQISTSFEFTELNPNMTLPQFKRLVPLGSVIVEGEKFCSWSGHDICISQRNELVVTENALALLRTCNLNYCDVTALSPMA